MPIKVVMPQLELYMTEGTIVEWLKQTGDKVIEKEPIVVIETMKAAVELKSKLRHQVQSIITSL